MAGKFIKDLYNYLMNSAAPPILVRWLRAAGEPTRLRLLALCADGAWSVSDLARALKQSEPRVSRHLRILCEAQLLVRLRHGQWVDYRLTEGDRKSTRLNSSHLVISYAVFCLKKKKKHKMKFVITSTQSIRCCLSSGFTASRLADEYAY